MTRKPTYKELEQRIKEFEKEAVEYKATRQALQLSEQRFSLIFESVADILYYIGVEPDDCFRFLSVNDAFLKATGLTRDQIVGKRIEEVIPQTSVQLVLDNYKKAIEENRIVRWEETSIYPAGEKNGVVSIAPFLNEKGICTHLVGSVHDITEPKHIEKALRESEKKFRNIIENLPMGIHMYQLDFDGQLRFIGANPAADKILGVDNTQYLGKSIYEAFPEIFQTDIPERFCEIAEKGGFWKKEDIVYKDRFIKGVFENYNFQTSPGIMVSLFNEITERKKNEETLKASHLFLEIANKYTEAHLLLNDFVAEIKSLTRCDAVGIRLLDEGGNIPYEAYEGFGKEFYDLESPLSIKSDQCMCVNVIKGVNHHNLPYVMKNVYTEGGSFFVNGTTKFLTTVSDEDKGRTRNKCNEHGYESVALVPIRLGDHILGLIHIADQKEDMVPLEIVEILEEVGLQLGIAIRRVQTETALRKSHNELERKVEERTAELMKLNEQLVEEVEERKKANKAFQEAERRYRTIFEQAPDAIVIIDPTTTLPITCNEMAVQLLGYSNEEFSKLRISDYEAIESLDEIEEHIKEVLRSGMAEFETKFRTKNGEIKDVLVIIRVIEIAGKKVFHNIFHDITEAKQAEEELRMQSQALDNMLEGVNIIRADDGVFVYSNPTYDEMLGYKRGELIGKHVSLINAPTDVPPEKTAEKIISTLNETGTWEGEVINIKKDGTRLLTYAKESTFEHTIHGRLCIGIQEDITERVQAEEALIESEAKWRSFVENAPDIILTVDKSLNILFINFVHTSLTMLMTANMEPFEDRPNGATLGSA